MWLCAVCGVECMYIWVYVMCNVYTCVGCVWYAVLCRVCSAMCSLDVVLCVLCIIYVCHVYYFVPWYMCV